jgi:hypothetical protein
MCPSETEISEFQHTSGVDKHVGRFYISVQDEVGVAMSYCPHHHVHVCLGVRGGYEYIPRLDHLQLRIETAYNNIDRIKTSYDTKQISMQGEYPYAPSLDPFGRARRLDAHNGPQCIHPPTT